MPSPVSLRELRRQLLKAGYRLERVTGSHHHFRGEGLPPIGFPVHKGKVLPVYVKQIAKAFKVIEEQRKEREDRRDG